MDPFSHLLHFHSLSPFEFLSLRRNILFYDIIFKNVFFIIIIIILIPLAPTASDAFVAVYVPEFTPVFWH